MQTTEITVRTGARRCLFDLTDACVRFVDEAVRDGAGDGLLNVFVPHATAGLVVMELGAGSDEDLMAALERLLPRDDRYRHRHGSPGHGADHLLPVLVPPSIAIPAEHGELLLGTWQRIVVVDPNRENNSRTIRLTFVPA